MKEIKAFKDALHKASNDTAHYMTAHLRAEASASGWPDHISRSMKVTHNNGSFDVHTHESLENHVHDLEYGTPDRRPTAAIRRFSNRTAEAESFLVKRVSRMLGDL
jgi:hypothetical protein